MEMADSARAAEAQPLDYNVVGRRIAAALIDTALLGALFFVMAAAFGDSGKDDNGMYQVRLYNAGFAWFLLVSYAYYVCLEGLLGATAGKLVMGLRVVSIDGDPCGFARALIRNILRIVDGFLFYVPGLVAIAATTKKQRIGDLAARTLVVRR